MSRVPGSSVVVKYIRESYQNDPFRIFLESLLIIFTIKYLTSKKYYPPPEGALEYVVLTEKEVDELVDEWTPEPLGPESLSDWAQMNLDNSVEIVGEVGLKVGLANAPAGKLFYNLASFNFLGLANNPELKEKSIEAISKYGVGTCGPPGFYGTLDVHLELEKEIAGFLGTEGAIIYPQSFSTISSVIPALSKRGDIIVCDSGVNFAVQKGVQISRSHVFYFDHNDMQDLERVLKQVQKQFEKKRLTRRFLVIEGLYFNSGRFCPLDKLVELKKEYKYRLICDESVSFGTVGRTGRGVSEVFGIDPSEIDIIIGSLAHSIAACGGFCAGSMTIVNHQRLSGQAYCFSASTPALLTVYALNALRKIRDGWNTGRSKNSDVLREAIEQVLGPIFSLVGDRGSPLLHICVNEESLPSRNMGVLTVLQNLVDEARKRGIFLMRSAYVEDQELFPVRPSIRLCVPNGFSEKEIGLISAEMKVAIEACQSILP
ncbi:unnamed protein product, partial [Sphagnum compactum]